MTEEPYDHDKFMEGVDRFLDKLRGKYPDTPEEAGYDVHWQENDTFHLDSVPVSDPPVKADTKVVPDTLRDMVEGK